MKRVVAVTISAFTMVVLAASTALAESYPPVVSGGGGNVSGSGGSGGTAFTGGDVSLFAIAAIAFLAVGATALLLSRRRSSTTA